MSLRTLLFLSLAAAVFTPVARAVESSVQTAPLISEAEAPGLPGEELRRLVAARRAVELGLPSVAAELYTQLLKSAGLTGSERDVLVLELVTARLNEGRVGDAGRALALHEGPRSAAYHLRAGLIAVRQQRVDVAKAALGSIKAEDVGAADRGWWYFLQGDVADATGDFPKARDFYQRAHDVTASEVQRAHFALARERARLSAGEATEAQLNTLRQNANRHRGKAVGYAYARQYAALLAARGRTTEAVDFLNKQLQALPAGERSVRDDFRLLLGLTAGAQRPEGRNALESLLTGAGDITLQRVALQLLARDAADAAFYAKLHGLITAPTAHPILADLLLVRAQLGLIEKRVPVVDRPETRDSSAEANQAQAELDAKSLLERFPTSDLKAAALGLLADLFWQQLRYRTAADYAGQARAELSAGDVRASLGVMVAEAYFNAKDYAAADEAYAVALNEVPAGVSRGGLIEQRVLSKILGGRLNEAAELLDSFAGDERLGVIHRWQAEWKLATDMQVAGRNAEAYARVNRLMERATASTLGGQLPSALRARMAWLQARLSLDADEPERTLQLAAALPALMEGLEAGLAVEVEASTRLLQAKARFRLGAPDEALKILESLRTDFPQTDAAVYSYVDEADHYAAIGRLDVAQGRLTTLAATFKQHDYAPYALYRAALTAEQRAQDSFYEEAYKILETLVTTYPTSKLVFNARLKQGDLARRLNDFPRARLTYEYLINNYAQHSGVLSAELALAACHRAQITSSDVSHYESALTILERLQELPTAPIDLRVEAGFQLGDLLATNGKPPDYSRAETVWWTLVTTYLLDDVQAAKLGAKGRYWLARALLRLGDLRRERGDLEEARNAYALVLRKELPFGTLAGEMLIRAGGNPPR
jgi:tetratricopeptide (TPR) repeat protein